MSHMLICMICVVNCTGTFPFVLTSADGAICLPHHPSTLPSYWAVMRMAGSRRLLLNSNMWTEMSCEKVNAKSIRFTGQDVDSGSIRIFLIKVSVVVARSSVPSGISGPGGGAL